MKVRHWNATRRNQRMTGVKRYENELWAALTACAEDDPMWTYWRDQRHPNRVLGSTFLSWFHTYRRGDADLVHVTEETVAPAAMIARPDQLVVTCHGLIPLRYPSLIQDPTTRLLWRLVPQAVRRASRIIAISEFTKQEIVDLLGVNPGRIDVVHHGIDHDVYRPMDRETSRATFNLDPDLQYVLVVASTLEQKRMDIVTKAFGRLRERRDDVRLLKAGYAEELRGEGIVNTGWVPEADLPKLYNAADVYMHPSEYESFGFPVLEAMACGVRVVTSDRASIPEIVSDAGRTADPRADDAVASFTEALNAALDDQRTDEAALRRSRQFSWERNAQEVLDVYRRCLSQ
jgi:glycosyltransferase involved in cell wall biosynthesis